MTLPGLSRTPSCRHHPRSLPASCNLPQIEGTLKTALLPSVLDCTVWYDASATGRQPCRCAYTPFEQQPLQPTPNFTSRVDAYGQACAGQRGRLPIVVGGTGFYLRWYVHGKPSTPRSTKESAALAEQALERVSTSLLARRKGKGYGQCILHGLRYDSSQRE